MRLLRTLPLVVVLGCSPTIELGPLDAAVADVVTTDLAPFDAGFDVPTAVDVPTAIDVRSVTDLGAPDRGTPIDLGSGPLPEYANCVSRNTSLACVAGVTCIIDTNPPNVGQCRRICSSNAQCPDGSQCIPQLLDDGRGLCGTPRAIGESCETGVEGPDNCAPPTGGRAACVSGHCVQACRVGTTTYACPTGTACSTDTVTSYDLTGPFRVCRSTAGDGGVATVPDSAVSTSPAYPLGCRGTAASTGSGAGVTLNAQFIESYHPASSGSITLLLTASAPDSLGPFDNGFLVEFTPVDGQLSYRSSSGTLRCGLIRYDGTAWMAVSEPPGGCGMDLTTMRLASPGGTCNGALVGVVAGVWGIGGTGIRATFAVSTAVAQSDIGPPPCRTGGNRCDSNDQCCSRSCSPIFSTCQ